MQYVFQLLLLYSAPGAVPAAELAPVIMSVSAKYNVDPVLVTALILAESGGRPYAYNATSQDHGLLQINHRLARDLSIGPTCLYNYRCNLLVGIRHFAALKRPCLYNLGKNRKLRGRYVSMCDAYEARLASLSK